MRLIIVRHGEPDYEKDCLTPRGHAQARAAAAGLREEGIEAVFSSPMGRAQETARYTAHALGLSIRTLDFMREIRWGSTDGRPLFADGHPWDIADELIRRGWDLTDPSWPDHPLFRRNRAAEEAARVAREGDRWLESLGYRREGLYYRCARPDDRQYTAALFCHGGSSTALLSRLLNLPFPYLCATLHLDFTGAFTVRFARRPGSLCLPIIEAAGDSLPTRSPSAG